MKKLYFLSVFLLMTVANVLAQETATPVLNKSNRIILHFKDTTGLFNQLGRILIDRGHDIDLIDRGFGIIRTKSSVIPGGFSFSDQMEMKIIFRDSTITFSSVAYSTGFPHEYKCEVYFTKKRKHIIDMSWDEVMKIGELLKPASISYLAVNNYSPPLMGKYRRMN